MEGRPQLSRERRDPTAGPGNQRNAETSARFEASVLPYLDAAFNLARYLLRDAHDAEDVVQEAVLRALRHFDGFRGTDGRAWLLSIVRNACFTQLRRRRTGPDIEFDEEVHGMDEETSQPESALARSLATDSVREALGELPPEFREVLVLRELEDLSYREIAQVAGVPIGTVMSRLARARRRLAQALGAPVTEAD